MITRIKSLLTINTGEVSFLRPGTLAQLGLRCNITAANSSLARLAIHSLYLPDFDVSSLSQPFSPATITTVIRLTQMPAHLPKLS
ncbi:MULTISPECIES: hypothetical protein [Pseudomonas]|uniref:hypothetical protein n=1 Tax=Pseudomonas TaxID=286 RepID=UPI0018A1CD7D|nr:MULTISPECIES: hypothetical protein [Pseudomonas]